MKKVSDYAPVPGNQFFTPGWVTHYLLDEIDVPHRVWECASGAGHMTNVLRLRGHDVFSTDIDPQDIDAETHNFLEQYVPAETEGRAIVTNPPYSQGLAERFVRQSLMLSDFTAMLLPLEFDVAASRFDLVRDAHFTKLILPRRISWANLERRASPSQVHAWYIWDRNAEPGGPRIQYPSLGSNAEPEMAA